MLTLCPLSFLVLPKQKQRKKRKTTTKQKTATTATRMVHVAQALPLVASVPGPWRWSFYHFSVPCDGQLARRRTCTRLRFGFTSLIPCDPAPSAYGLGATSSLRGPQARIHLSKNKHGGVRSPGCVSHGSFSTTQSCADAWEPVRSPRPRYVYMNLGKRARTVAFCRLPCPMRSYHKLVGVDASPLSCPERGRGEASGGRYVTGETTKTAMI